MFLWVGTILCLTMEMKELGLQKQPKVKKLYASWSLASFSCPVRLLLCINDHNNYWETCPVCMTSLISPNVIITI